MKIPIFIEPNYINSPWCLETLSGIRQECSRKKYKMYFLDNSLDKKEDVDDFEDELCIVIGTSATWVPKAVRSLALNGKKSVVVSYRLKESFAGQSMVLMNHYTAMQDLISYLCAAEHSRIALYGINPNSSADLIKQQCFLESEILQAGKQDIYPNLASLENCFQHFRKHVSSYNAVICSTDIVAVSLLRRLHAEGISVPDDLYLVGFGSSMLSQLTDPSLTTASLDHWELGRQAVNIFAYLARQTRAVSVTVHVRCQIAIRGSTAYFGPVQSVKEALDHPLSLDVNFYADDEATSILSLDTLLSDADRLDLHILLGIQNGKTIENLADQLNTSDATIRYRLHRLLIHNGLPDRTQLFRLLENYLRSDALQDAIDMKP